MCTIKVSTSYNCEFTVCFVLQEKIGVYISTEHKKCEFLFKYSENEIQNEFRKHDSKGNKIKGSLPFPLKVFCQKHSLESSNLL